MKATDVLLPEDPEAEFISMLDLGQKVKVYGLGRPVIDSELLNESFVDFKLLDSALRNHGLFDKYLPRNQRAS